MTSIFVSLCFRAATTDKRGSVDSSSITVGEVLETDPTVLLQMHRTLFDSSDAFSFSPGWHSCN